MERTKMAVKTLKIVKESGRGQNMKGSKTLIEKKKSYKESIGRIGKLLNEKKLKESTFASVIEPVKQMMTTLETTNNVVTDIPYNEIIGPESNLELDVSEVELNDKGAITEATKKKRALKEAVGASAAIREYIQQGGEKDYDSFVAFCNTNGYEDVALNYKRGLFNYKYEELYAKIAINGPVKSFATPNEPPEVSKNLENFIELANAGTEFVESAIDTVAAKYKSINIKLQKVILGKSLKNYYLLMGDAGIGKSYIVREALRKVGKNDVPMVTGSVGTSQSAVAIFLWKNRNKELVVLDDCDSMIKANVSVDTANMLKGAMDPDKHHVHISPTIRKNATYILEGAGESIYDDDAEDLVPEEGVEEGAETDSGMIPEDWDFNARVIFISNLTESEVNPAVLSRCDYYELHLTQEEYMVRLGSVINGIDCGQGKVYDEEEVKDAKALLVMTLAALIEAGNKGVKLYNRQIRLRSGGLEFRLVKDMVEGFLSLVDYEANDNPNESRDDIKKRCIPEWVRTIVIPRIAA